jgi:antitoxin ParD1/3/4
MMGKLSQKPELEAFAEQCVASGRFGDLHEVMDAALALLREQERQRAAFVATLDAAREEAGRDGVIALDDVIAAIAADEAADSRAEEAARRAAP